ncbi:UvrD-helicase domain-containing protein [Plantactinospora sonchi]|uniref:DNA 3'-5' helicase n=1 Tax=Plantactinospora sonchi TaxID=1544735 RepID=A0ABU7RXQ3_9ACTN
MLTVLMLAVLTRSVSARNRPVPPADAVSFRANLVGPALGLLTSLGSQYTLSGGIEGWMYDHRYTPTFKDCIDRYLHRPGVLAALSQTLTELAIKPFGNPRLQTHAVKRAQPGTYTSYVTNHGHRLIWRQVGQVIVLLLFGEHDAVYRRAERLRLEIDDSQNILRVIDEDPGSGDRVPYQQRRAEEGRLFMAWNDVELAAFGFQQQEIPILRGLNSDDDLTALDGRMRSEAWQVAMNLAMYGTADGSVLTASEEPDESPLTVEPTMPPDPEIAHALDVPTASREFVHVPADQLAEVLTRPIEDWMVYLDPAQQDLVGRVYKGPARIRGAAGTGKTVVALHRARELARLGRRVLVTTYVRNLPEVYEQIFARFAPEVRGNVEFSSVHRWAYRYLHRNGAAVRIDPGAARNAWKAACDRMTPHGSPLRKAGLTSAYLQEEVDWVIRGRALPSLDTYLGLERNGRGTPLAVDLRREVWRLAEEYAAELARRGIADFTDALLRAYTLVADNPPEYDAVIVDEAQDLTDAALRLLYALVGDRPNGLLLVGDGQQAIYPGGFNLGSLGINVRGRSHVLNRNYRNTREVYAAAQNLMRDHKFDDGGQEAESGLRTVEVVRSGSPPSIAGSPTEEEHDLALAAAIESAIGGGTDIGDLAVLVPTNSLVDRYAELIDSLGLPTQQLKDYDGSPSSLVKVGTYQRAKGLEFKQVFLPRLDPASLRERRPRGTDIETHNEQLALLRRQLFVAMTRARDGLWLGWVGEPSSLLPPSLTGTLTDRDPGS